MLANPLTSPHHIGQQPTGLHDFVVVANRLPVDKVSTAQGAVWRPSPGGLVTALWPVMTANDGAWVGWGGTEHSSSTSWQVNGVTLQSVALSDDELAAYYEGQSNGTIWPLYHDCVQPPEFRPDWVESYRDVNQRFAAAAARVAAPGATVWVHDYQLQLVPALLRELRPDLRIGFFLHIPFPPEELFLQLPERADIVKGLLGADLIGFQRPGGARNFLQVASRLLDVAHTRDGLTVNGRQVTVAAFPISIDVGDIERIARDPVTQRNARSLRRELGDPKTVLLGVDRLDYTKGIEHRLKAFEALLAEKRLSAADTKLVQIAVPSRGRIDKYQELGHRVNRMVGRINGEFGAMGQPAVHYLHRNLDRQDLVALYLAADIMLVTPLRDGMNLVAKEYVAARHSDDGALILSEFAGAATELQHAHLVNPHDIEALKASIMSAKEAAARPTDCRIRLMRSHLRTHDVHAWAKSFLSALRR